MDKTFSVFILKANPSSLAQAETFLKNRKWIVASSTNLKEALGYIIKKQPNYVLITADHPNRKVKILPKMLTQAFPLKVIGFAEKTGTESSRSLTTMALEYNLYPPVSGPAIERIVLKIIRDEEIKAQQAIENEKIQAAGGVGGGNETITLKGGSPTSTEEEKRRSFEQARAALSQMISSDGDHDSVDDSGVMIQKGGAQNKFNEHEQGNGNSNKFNEHEQGQGNKNKFNEHEQGRSNQNQYSQQQLGFGNSNQFGQQQGGGEQHKYKEYERGEGSRSGDLTPQYPEGSSQSFEEWEADQKKKRQAQFGQNQNSNNSDSSSEQDANKTQGWNQTKPSQSSSDLAAEESLKNYQSRQKKRTPIMEAEYQARKEKHAKYFRDAEEKKEKESIFIQGSKEALDKSVISGGELEAEVESSTNVACITIESPKFKGYLICALAEDQKVDGELIELINKRLIHFLKEKGESVKEQDSMDIKIQAVDFIDWSIEQAEFLKKSIHKGKEIAMAFFPHAELKTEFEVNEFNMIQLKIEDLKTDAPVEFDLYLYMPENDKYILYTPEGGNFMAKQKERLQNKGIKDMHVKPSAVNGLKKYQAQNYLNEKIDSYKKSNQQNSTDFNKAVAS